MASGPITSWQIDGETVTDFILGAPKSLQMVTAAMKLKDSPGLMHDTGCLGLVHWDDPEGWGGRREEGSGWGTHVYLWWIHFDI